MARLLVRPFSYDWFTAKGPHTLLIHDAQLTELSSPGKHNLHVVYILARCPPVAGNVARCRAEDQQLQLQAASH